MGTERLFVFISILLISAFVFALLKYSFLFRGFKAVALNSSAGAAVIWSAILMLSQEYGFSEYISLRQDWLLIASLFIFTILAFSLLFYNLQNIDQEKNSLGYFIISMVAGIFLVAIQCNFYLEITGFESSILNNTLLFAVLQTVASLFLLTRVLQQVRFDQLHSPDKVKNHSLAVISLIGGNSLLGAIMTVAESFQLSLNYDLFNIEFISIILLFVITLAKAERQYLDERVNLNFMAYHDSLTGLYNRLFIQEELKRRTAEETPFYLLLLDLDYFKHINDTHGHLFGDEVLKKVAAFITGQLGSRDIAGRLGGDEFVIILNEQENGASLDDFCDRILGFFSQPVVIKGRQITLTTSMGVSAYPENADSPEDLLIKADISMYKTKEDGRNSYTVFNTSLEEAFKRDVTLQADLSKALINQEFEVYYQPMVNLKEKKVIGFEALLRWNHPEQGRISPGQFIHIAEETGQIIPIGEWVAREACRQIHQWNNQFNKEYSISINLSQRQFSKKGIFEVFSGIIDEIGIAPSLVTIEITESMAMVNTEHTLSLLNKFKRKGFGIAIDDFGTGYSSLSYLKDFSIKSIKIDRSFIKSVNDSGKDDAIVKAILSIAGNLGIEVTAEGVEQAQQEYFLVNQKCDYAQGYHYSKPLNRSDLLKFLKGQEQIPEEAAVPISQ